MTTAAHAQKFQAPSGTDPRRTVVAAAIRNESRTMVVCGARHWDSVMTKVVSELPDGLGPWGAPDDQGFIDQWGQWISREEGLDLVRVSGQPFDDERNGGSKTELFSEGVW